MPVYGPLGDGLIKRPRTGNCYSKLGAKPYPHTGEEQRTYSAATLPALGWFVTSKKTRTFINPHFGHLSRLASRLIGKFSPRVQISVVMSSSCDQRIDHHVLTEVRNRLVKDGAISRTNRANAPWFHISNSPPQAIAARLDEQVAVFNAYNAAAMDAIRKCVTLDCIPVLIARRIPFVTFMLFTKCGGLIHQTYNQLYPEADADVAAKAKDKKLLGYHDIRLGNQPDARLTKFINVNLPKIAEPARKRFEEYKDLLWSFSSGDMGYDEFAARVRRRSQGTKEDNDFPGDDLPEWGGRTGRMVGTGGIALVK